jgi:VWFA-related protein
MRKPPSALRLWLLLAAGAGSGFAQTSAPASPSPQAPTVLRSTTRLVQINVIVHNKKGEPVEGLRKEDFAIQDQGQEQQVATFFAIAATPREPSAIPALPPNVFTNRTDQTGGTPGSVTVILFDALNTAIQDQFYARQQVVKFLRQLQPQDHVAIYVLTTKIVVLNEFTQDSRSLLQAIELLGGYSSAPLDAATPKADNQSIFAVKTPETDTMASKLKDFLDAADGKISDFANINRAETTTSAIEAIANHVARIPGRKSLVWVSGSFPMTIGFDGETLSQPGREQRSFREELEHAARALNQANMAIYPVDARGLMTLSQFSASNSARFDPRFAPRGMAPYQNDFDTMIVLADRTGGKASYNTNDIEGAVQRAIADGQFTYTLGFYPTHDKWDGKFHELKVHVNEKGLTLRYRKGYFASADPPNGPAEIQAALDAAIGSPVEWTNLDVEVTVKAFDVSTRTVELQVAMDTHELLFDSQDGRWNGKLYVFFGQLGAGNKIITSEKETFGMKLKQETYEKLMKIGTKFTGKLVLSPEVEDLRVIVQDASSGSIGTLTIPIKKLLLANNVPGGNPTAAQKP